MSMLPLAGMGGMMAQQMPEPPPKKKGGMFGSGVNAAELIQALLSGALAARGNPVGVYGLQAMQQKRQQALDETQYQSRRKDHLADYGEMQRMQQQYGAPPQPHRWESNDGSLMELDPATGQPRVVYKDPTPPMMMVPGPNGQMFMVPRAMPQQQSGPQPGQVEDGFQFIGGDPADKNNWKPAGGPTPQASGGFPRPY